MISAKKIIMCVLLSLNFIFFTGCGPSIDFLYKQKQGMFPTGMDFPNTRWVCRELDMVLNAFEYSEDMIGIYEVNSESYRAVARFEFAQIQISLYSYTDVSKSEFSNSMVSCEPILCGYICANYFFDKETETIVCSILNSMSVDTETIPQELTFKKDGVLQHKQELRWYAEELDMYLDSFVDVDGYFRGEIILDEKKHYVNAIEVGNNNYYVLSIENGKSNNLKPGTTSTLIYMYFKIEDDKIVATVCDGFLFYPEAFPYWLYGDMIITFTASVPK